MLGLLIFDVLYLIGVVMYVDYNKSYESMKNTIFDNKLYYIAFIVATALSVIGQLYYPESLNIKHYDAFIDVQICLFSAIAVFAGFAGFIYENKRLRFVLKVEKTNITIVSTALCIFALLIAQYFANSSIISNINITKIISINRIEEETLPNWLITFLTSWSILNLYIVSKTIYLIIKLIVLNDVTGFMNYAKEIYHKDQKIKDAINIIEHEKSDTQIKLYRINNSKNNNNGGNKRDMLLDIDKYDKKISDLQKKIQIDDLDMLIEPLILAINKRDIDNFKKEKNKINTFLLNCDDEDFNNILISLILELQQKVNIRSAKDIDIYKLIIENYSILRISQKALHSAIDKISWRITHITQQYWNEHFTTKLNLTKYEESRYKSCVKDFVSFWETIPIKFIETKKKQNETEKWSEFYSAKNIYIQHLLRSAYIACHSIYHKNTISSYYYYDIILRWHQNKYTKNFNVSRNSMLEYSNHAIHLISDATIKENWSATYELIKNGFNKKYETNPIIEEDLKDINPDFIFDRLLKNTNQDIRLIVSAIIIEWALNADKQDTEKFYAGYAKKIIENTYRNPNEGHDNINKNDYSFIWNSLIRLIINNSFEYRNNINEFIREINELDRDDIIGSRVYSYWGRDDINKYQDIISALLVIYAPKEKISDITNKMIIQASWLDMDKKNIIYKIEEMLKSIESDGNNNIIKISALLNMQDNLKDRRNNAKEILQSVKNDLEHRANKEVAKSDLSQTKLTKFKDDFTRLYKNEKSLEKLLTNQNVKTNRVNIINFKNALFGCQEMLDKKLFVDCDTIDISNLPSIYAEGIMRGKNNKIFDKISDKCQQITEKQIKNIISKTNPKDLFCIVNRRIDYKKSNLGGLTYRRNYDAEQRAKPIEFDSFYAYLEFKEFNIPCFNNIYASYEKSNEYDLIILNKNSLGQLKQYLPLNKNLKNKDKLIGDNNEFYCDIRAYSHDKKLMKYTLENPPQWLIDDIPEDKRKDYLKQKVLLELYTSFEFELAHDFWGYKVKLEESPEE